MKNMKKTITYQIEIFNGMPAHELKDMVKNMPEYSATNIVKVGDKMYLTFTDVTTLHSGEV